MRANVKIIAIVACVAAVSMGGYALSAYLAPQPADRDVYDLVGRDIHIGAPIFAVEGYLAMRHIGFGELDSDAAGGAIANARNASSLSGSLPDHDDPPTTIAVPLANGACGRPDTIYLFFDKWGFLIAHTNTSKLVNCSGLS
jgi:hypothetical protein